MAFNHLMRFTIQFEAKRFYARGTRLIPSLSSVTRNSKNRLDQSKTQSNNNEFQNEIINESAEELLKNATTGDAMSSYQHPKRIEDVWDSAPYPKNSNWKQSQAKFSVRPRCDPRETSVILFPGQGTQFVGMAKELLQYPNVSDMFQMASSILKYDLLQLCLKGPKGTLDKTIHCQPAVMVTSLACLEKLKATSPKVLNSCVATAGFSVGEISALVFAGALSFENAVKLVKYRAEAMQLASEMTPSGMMTVFYGYDSNLKLACSTAKEHCAKLNLELFDCRIANYLYPDCKVVAGNNEALDFITRHAADFKLKRLKKLAVSGAFHSQLMAPAVQVLKKALMKIPVHDPVIPVHSNVDGKRYKNSKHIISQLPKQIVSPVRWEQTMHIIYERNNEQEFPLTYECGPGRSLSAILRKVNAKAAKSCTSIDV